MFHVEPLPNLGITRTFSEVVDKKKLPGDLVVDDAPLFGKKTELVGTAHLGLDHFETPPENGRIGQAPLANALLFPLLAGLMETAGTAVTLVARQPRPKTILPLAVKWETKDLWLLFPRRLPAGQDRPDIVAGLKKDAVKLFNLVITPMTKR